MNRKMFLAALAVFGLYFFLPQTMTSAASVETREVTAEPPLQISNRTGMKVVIQVNSSDTIPSGISKQVLAVKNLHDQYTALGMKSGKDYEIVMVFRGDGARFLLTDAAYALKVKQPHPKGNPNTAIIEGLRKGGVKMYECNVAMTLLGYKPEDILPFSRIVASGIGAVLDLQKSGYLLITP